MTNRERLLQANTYDLLLAMQDKLEPYRICVLTVLGEKDISGRCSGLCELCLQRWLNEEAKAR